MQHLPTEGPVILVTNCVDMQSCLQLVSATDRTTKVVLIEDPAALSDGFLLRTLAERANVIAVRPKQDVQRAWQEALATLQGGHLLAISLVHEEHGADIAALLQKLRHDTNAPLLPVFCGTLDDAAGVAPRVRVVFGEIMTQAGNNSLEDCKKAIGELGDWIRKNDDIAGTGHH